MFKLSSMEKKKTIGRKQDLNGDFILRIISYESVSFLTDSFRSSLA